MAYDRDKKYQEAHEAITKHRLFFIEDVCAYIGITRPTFYEWWPGHSKEYREITDALDLNKITTKVGIRKKLYDSNKAGELLALYKLICSDDERRMLSMQYMDHTSKGERMQSPIDLSQLPDDVLEKLLAAKK
jgi:hypothetical protein